MMTAKLGDLANLDFGYAFDSKAFNKEGKGLPLVRIRDVTPGESSTYFSGEYDSRYLVNDGDYLIGMDGQFNLGQWRGGQALLNQRVCRIGEVHPSLNLSYLIRFLPNALAAVEAETPFVTVKHLSAKVLRAIDVPLPRLEEQWRIAEILDQADAIRAKRQQLFDHLDTLTQSIFRDMFSSITESRVSLSSVAYVKGGKRLPKGADFADGTTNHPYLRVTDLRGGRIRTKGLRYVTPEVQDLIARYTVSSGDVVISIAGSIGLTAEVPETLAGANLTENAAKIVAKRHDEYVGTWMTHALRTPDIRSQIAGYVGQATIGKLALFRIEKLELAVPLLALQREFANRVKRVEAQRELVQRALDADNELLASLQSQAFRGEL